MLSGGGVFGACRPRKYGCQGATDEMHGTPAASHWSATGLTVSGVEATSIRSMPSAMSSPATDAARAGSDWLSLAEISNLWRASPTWMPSPMAAVTPSKMNWSASPKPASGPVVGLT